VGSARRRAAGTATLLQIASENLQTVSMDDPADLPQYHRHDFLFSGGELKSTYHGGDFMNRAILSCKRFAWIAVLSGAIVTSFSTPVYAQQEVDPTWYNPWAPATTSVQHDQQAVAHKRHAAKVTPVSSTKRTAKANEKHSANRPRPS